MDHTPRTAPGFDCGILAKKVHDNNAAEEYTDAIDDAVQSVYEHPDVADVCLCRLDGKGPLWALIYAHNSMFAKQRCADKLAGLEKLHVNWAMTTRNDPGLVEIPDECRVPLADQAKVDFWTTKWTDEWDRLASIHTNFVGAQLAYRVRGGEVVMPRELCAQITVRTKRAVPLDEPLLPEKIHNLPVDVISGFARLI